MPLRHLHVLSNCSFIYVLLLSLDHPEQGFGDVREVTPELASLDIYTNGSIESVISSVPAQLATTHGTSFTALDNATLRVFHNAIGQSLGGFVTIALAVTFSVNGPRASSAGFSGFSYADNFAKQSSIVISQLVLPDVGHNSGLLTL